MKKFNEWLSIEENYSQINRVEIQIILNDLNKHEGLYTGMEFLP